MSMSMKYEHEDEDEDVSNAFIIAFSLGPNPSVAPDGLSGLHVGVSFAFRQP